MSGRGEAAGAERAGARRLLGDDAPELSLTSLLSYFDPADRPRIIAGLSFDITQLRDAEAARGESEALFRQRLTTRRFVAMARDLGKTTIAEGVEDAATLERLRHLGVDQAQGYHIGRPAEIGLPVPVAQGLVARGT